jgi:hypothetical protein
MKIRPVGPELFLADGQTFCGGDLHGTSAFGLTSLGCNDVSFGEWLPYFRGATETLTHSSNYTGSYHVRLEFLATPL